MVIFELLIASLTVITTNEALMTSSMRFEKYSTHSLLFSIHARFLWPTCSGRNVQETPPSVRNPVNLRLFIKGCLQSHVILPPKFFISVVKMERWKNRCSHYATLHRLRFQECQCWRYGCHARLHHHVEWSSLSQWSCPRHNCLRGRLGVLG